MHFSLAISALVLILTWPVYLIPEQWLFRRFCFERFFFVLTHEIIRVFSSSFLALPEEVSFLAFLFEKEGFLVCYEIEAEVLGKQIRSLVVKWCWLAPKTI